MTSTSPDIRGLEADAYQQSGYFTSAQAREHRVSRQLLDHHVKQERFERVRRGLYRVQGFPSSEHDDIREKWMAVGPEKAIVSHESALALLELSDNIPGEIHLLVPRQIPRTPSPAGRRHPHSPRRREGRHHLAGRHADHYAGTNARGCRRRAPTRTGSDGRPTGTEPWSSYAPAA